MAKPSPAEDMLRRNAPAGIDIDFASIDPNNRVRLPASLLLEVLIDSRRPPHQRGVRLKHANFVGPLDLSQVGPIPAIAFDDCAFEAEVILSASSLASLDFNFCTISALVADHAQIKHNLRLYACDIGLINMSHASVGGSVWILGSSIGEAPEPRGCHAEGVDIAGSLILRHARLVSGEYISSVVAGGLYLLGARIRGSIEIDGSHLIRPDGHALLADRIRVEGGIFLRSVKPTDGAPIQVTVRGSLSLLGARIDGQLSLKGALVESFNGAGALRADRAHVTDGIFIQVLEVPVAERVPCVIKGGVMLLGAAIEGQLVIKGATILNEGGVALEASGADIGDSLFVVGSVHPGNNSVLTPSVLRGSLILAGSHIKNRLSLGDGVAIEGEIDLTGCRVAELNDELGHSSGSVNVWEKASAIRLDGFAYERFSNRPGLWDKRARAAWIRSAEGHSPGPWDQLQKVYSSHGWEDEARFTALARNRDNIARGSSNGARKAWRRLLGWTIGFGYQTWRAGLWALVCIVVFALLAWLGREDLDYVGSSPPVASPLSAASASAGLGRGGQHSWLSARPAGGFAQADNLRQEAISSVKVGAEKETTTTRDISFWRAVAYSVDVFLPIGDFRVASEWRASGWLEVARFIVTLLGWALGTLFITGFTKVVRA